MSKKRKTYDLGFDNKVSKKDNQGFGEYDDSFAQELSRSMTDEQKMEIRRWVLNRFPASEQYQAQLNEYDVHAKLQVSQPGDASEVQADKVADAFVDGNADAAQSELSKPVTESGVSGMSDGTEVPEGFESQLQSANSGGEPLDENLRGELEQTMGADLSGVKIHNNPESHQLAEDIHARAFETGGHIHFGEGEYDPHSEEGKRLIGHEVAHVVQGGVNFISTKQTVLNRAGQLTQNVTDAIAWNKKNYTFDLVNGIFSLIIKQLKWLSGDAETYDMLLKMQRIDLEFTMLAMKAQAFLNKFVKVAVDGKWGNNSKQAITTWANQCAETNKVYPYSQLLVMQLWNATEDTDLSLRQLANTYQNTTSSYFAMLVVCAQRVMYPANEKAVTGKMSQQMKNDVEYQYNLKYNPQAIPQQPVNFMKPINQISRPIVLSPPIFNPATAQYSISLIGQTDAIWAGDRFSITMSFRKTPGRLIGNDLVCGIKYNGQDQASPLNEVSVSLSDHLNTVPAIPDAYFIAMSDDTSGSSLRGSLYIDIYKDGKTTFILNDYVLPNNEWTPAWNEHRFTLQSATDNITSSGNTAKMNVQSLKAIPTYWTKKIKAEGMETPKLYQGAIIDTGTQLTTLKSLFDLITTNPGFHADATYYPWLNIGEWISKQQIAFNSGKISEGSAEAGQIGTVYRFMQYQKEKRLVAAAYAEPSVHPRHAADEAVKLANQVLVNYDDAVIQATVNGQKAQLALEKADAGSISLPFNITNIYLRSDIGIQQELNDLKTQVADLYSFRSIGGVKMNYRNVDIKLGIGSTSNKSVIAGFHELKLKELIDNQRNMMTFGMSVSGGQDKASAIVAETAQLESDVLHTQRLIGLAASYAMVSKFNDEYKSQGWLAGAIDAVLPGSGETSAASYVTKFGNLLQQLDTVYAEKFAGKKTDADVTKEENKIIGEFMKIVSTEAYATDMKFISDRLKTITSWASLITSLAILVVAIVAGAVTGGAATLLMAEMGISAGLVTGTVAFLSEVAMFTFVDRSLNAKIFGETGGSYWSDFAKNAFFFGGLKLMGKAVNAAFRAFVGEAELTKYTAEIKVTSGAANFIALQLYAEGEHYIATGKTMTADERGKSIFHNAAMFIAAYIGGKIAQPLTSRMENAAARAFLETKYANELATLEAERIAMKADLNPLLGQNPAEISSEQNANGLRKLEILFNKESALLEKAKKQATDAKTIAALESKIADHKAAIIRLNIELSAMGFQIESSAQMTIRDVEPGIKAYSETDAATTLSQLKEYYESNKGTWTETDPKKGVYKATVGMEMIVYVKESYVKQYIGKDGAYQVYMPSALKRYPSDPAGNLNYVKEHMTDSRAKSELQRQFDIAENKQEYINKLNAREESLNAAGKGLEQSMIEDALIYNKEISFGTKTGKEKTDLTVAEGTVQMELHPDYETTISNTNILLDEIKILAEYSAHNSNPLVIVNNGINAMGRSKDRNNAGIEINRIVDQQGQDIRVEIQLIAIPKMEYRTFLHEKNHLEQIKKMLSEGTSIIDLVTDSYYEISRSSGKTAVKEIQSLNSKNKKSIMDSGLTDADDSITEYHNRLTDYIEFMNRINASGLKANETSILSLSNGIRYYRDNYAAKATSEAKQKMKVIDVEIPILEQQWKALNGEFYENKLPAK